MTARRDIDRGAVVRVHGTVYTVLSAAPYDPAVHGHATFGGWPPSWEQDAVAVEMQDHTGGATSNAVMPRRPGRYRTDVIEVLAPAEEEGHYAVCRSCSDPWPCQEVATIRRGVRQVDALLTSIEFEAAHPWPCVWCSRFSLAGARRFKTERGMKSHLRRCGMNPANWDLSQWLHLFGGDLSIRGGCAPWAAGDRFGDFNELVAVNRAVQRHALAGTLPERVEDLDIFDQENDR